MAGQTSVNQCDMYSAISKNIFAAHTELHLINPLVSFVSFVIFRDVNVDFTVYILGIGIREK